VGSALKESKEEVPHDVGIRWYDDGGGILSVSVLLLCCHHFQYY